MRTVTSLSFVSIFKIVNLHVQVLQIMSCLSHLGLLTKKFINLIKHAEDGILDLNKAADTLEVIIFLSALIYPVSRFC